MHQGTPATMTGFIPSKAFLVPSPFLSLYQNIRMADSLSITQPVWNKEAAHSVLVSIYCCRNYIPFKTHSSSTTCKVFIVTSSRKPSLFSPCPHHSGFLPSIWPHVIQDSGKWPDILTPQWPHHLHQTLAFDISRVHLGTWHTWSCYITFLTNLNVFHIFPWNWKFVKDYLTTVLLKVDALM